MRGKEEKAGGCRGKREGGAPPRGRSQPAKGERLQGGGRKRRIDGLAYTYPQNYEIKRRAVRLYLEEGMPAELVAQEIGVAKATLFKWLEQYRKEGEQGLEPKGYGNSRSVNKLPPAVREKIAALKQENPGHGVKRLSQILRRLFGLKASPETVRRELKKKGLVVPKPKARKPPEAPQRRFEASTPNQMWQGVTGSRLDKRHIGVAWGGGSVIGMRHESTGAGRCRGRMVPRDGTGNGTTDPFCHAPGP